MPTIGLAFKPLDLIAAADVSDVAVGVAVVDVGIDVAVDVVPDAVDAVLEDVVVAEADTALE